MKMFNSPHLGEIIVDSLEEFGLGIRDVALSAAQRLVTYKATVTPEMVVKLSKVLGSSPRLWLKLQDVYGLDKVEKAIDISRLASLFKPVNLHYA
ncbi:HigA family addiction module antitoxin [Photorhabdus sp. CRCIA-P01]|uniref:HigA family addiction module antitoxin n=1 Tax=Photorhabdus sp. CRCIA-P01 TaxID=2019570 RepID=UPI000E59F375|nr:HigA family addiction module antitoxin [Photorhabdus sp. CRCIA-P01]